MAFLDNNDKKRPAYVHQDYPKHINFPDGTYKKAANLEEEKAILAEFGHKLPDQPAKTVEDAPKSAAVDSGAAEEKAKQALIRVAQHLEIKIDKRWGLDKIQEAIDAAFTSVEQAEKEDGEKSAKEGGKRED